MTNKFNYSVEIPLDDDGMLGRECLKCKKYFKLKPGTGLPTKYCHCPYCEYEGDSDTFWTEAQIEFAQSLALKAAVNKIIKPSIENLNKSFKELERKSKNNLLKFTIKISNSEINLPIKYYNEKELETEIECTNCSLKFSIYGVFARCPDCSNLNAFYIFNKSLESCNKQIIFFNKSEMPEEIKKNSLKYLLSESISAFDALGKELRRKKPEKYPEKPKNLFQNLNQLNIVLKNLISNKHSNWKFLLLMFQVRHIHEHNMGVIDDDFIKKVNNFESNLGMKYNLSIDELKIFLENMQELGNIIMEDFENN